MRKVLWSLAWGLGVTVLAFAIGVPHRTRPFGEALLTPGFWLPKAYWGGVHDPVQIAIVFLMNVLFYAIAAFCVRWVVAKYR